MFSWLLRLWHWLKSRFCRTLPQAVLPDELEVRLIHADWQTRDVLVGSFRSGDQLRACLRGNFYYIPADLVEEDDLPIRYVAAFQTPRVFGKQAGIRYFGAVKSMSLVPRKSISEVPKRHGSPEALYYRLELHGWTPLETPIKPKEAAFVRAFTNLFLLQNSRYVPELLLRSEEEYRLYRALQDLLKRGKGGFLLGSLRVTLKDGQIFLEEAGKTVSCSMEDFSARPVSTLQSLWDRFGGEGSNCFFSPHPI